MHKPKKKKRLMQIEIKMVHELVMGKSIPKTHHNLNHEKFITLFPIV